MSNGKGLADTALGFLKGRKSPFVIAVLAMAAPIILQYFGQLTTLTLIGVQMPVFMYFVVYVILALSGKCVEGSKPKGDDA